MTVTSSRPSQAVATISTAALQHNLQQARRYAPDVRVLAVIKANGYGHGLATVARALVDADAFAVGTMHEGHELRMLMPQHDIVVLQGIVDADDVRQCIDEHLQVIIHSEYQLALLESAGDANNPVQCWLKVDTGMHRLGVMPDQVAQLVQRCQQSPHVADKVTVMSHLACADEPEHPENRMQMETFADLEPGDEYPRSLANSAATIAFPDARYDWVRPGIMLYGISPLQGQTADALGLRPVMTLKSRLIAINQLLQGDRVGYGATWQCPEDMPVGVVGIGYGDGYPRHAPSGTPVLIRGQRVPVIGRISMDLITVDLRGLSEAETGDEVVLWGDGLPVDEIADAAGTIGYELVCRLSSRVEFRVS